MMQGFDSILNFLIQHWMLSGALVGIVILFLLNEWRFRAMGILGLNPFQLVEKLNHAHGVVLDIRTQERFQLGHILNAINIPQSDIPTRLSQLNKYKSKPIIIVCASGQDSPKVGKNLKTQGFVELYYLIGGMNSWNEQNMPITKK